MPSNSSPTRSNRGINKKIDRLSDSINSIYQDTYKSRIDNKDNINRITSDIEDNLDKILSKVNDKEVSAISKLYIRAQEKANSSYSEIKKSLEELFDANGNILDSINVDMIRNSIQSMDYQYDLICKYMPKLADALDVKKDNVLSSDNFTKEFINTMSKRSGKDYLETFTDRANHIKEKYRFEERIEDIYEKTSKYGEYFLYHVPYRKAFERLLTRKRYYDTLGTAPNGIQTFNYESGQMIWESNKVLVESNGFNPKFINEVKSVGDDMKVYIDFDDSGVIEEAVLSYQNMIQISQKVGSITESYWCEFDNKSGVIPVTEEKLPRFNNNGLSPEGLINKSVRPTGKEDAANLSKDIKGSIAYEIPRDQIIPIYIMETCVGYLYLQVANNYVKGLTMTGRNYNSVLNNSDLIADEWDRQNDMLVGQIAASIASQVDSKFINANLDLKDEIYSVLRYNDKFCSTRGINNIKCTFLPAEDVQHFYFKLDPKTHRGISDLADAVIPAMIWCMSYLNDALARMSRGQDKRVYYVQQTIEKNVARTMLNVISQLKKGNMGMRQLENMNTIFNVVGKFNDHVIPLGPSGEPPIKMEVMQGQDIQTPTELMDRMEEQAIFTTDVPPEFLQSLNQVDFATRFTMSNSKFLRKIFKRQAKCQKDYSITFRKFYNYEYDDHDNTIEVRLPAPAYLAMTNTTQLLENADAYAQKVVDLITSDDEDDNVKNRFKARYIKKTLGTYINFDEAEDILQEVRVEIASEKEDSDMGSEDLSDDEY